MLTADTGHMPYPEDAYPPDAGSADRIDNLAVRPTVRQALREARAALRRIYADRLEQVILYGSQGRGNARPDSDVDLMVVLRDPVDKYRELQAVSPLVFDLMLSTGELVTFTVAGIEKASRSETPLFVNVRREGIHL